METLIKGMLLIEADMERRVEFCSDYGERSGAVALGRFKGRRDP